MYDITYFNESLKFEKNEKSSESVNNTYIINSKIYSVNNLYNEKESAIESTPTW